MKKLTGKTWYTIEAYGHATIYAVNKTTGKKEAVFTCHSACIPLIEKDGLQAENVVLKRIKA